MEELKKEIRNSIQEIGRSNIAKAHENNSKFYIGELIISDGVRNKGYSYDSIELNEKAYKKFINCDWGTINATEDIETNERNIERGYGDVMGEYEVDGNKIWIKTDLGKDTVTTIYLPSEW